MPEPDKAAERSTLILQLGRLLAPIDQLAEKPTPPTSTEYQVAAATFRADFDKWRGGVSQFVIIGGVTFEHEFKDIGRGCWDILASLARLARDTTLEPEAKQHQLRNLLDECKKQTIAAIDQVPIDWAPQLLEEQTPFGTYLKIRDAITTAKRRIHYFDRYLESDFYPLYLRGVDRSLEIRLVTTKGNKDYGVTNILAISRLAAHEFANYQLIECDPSDLHDRNLRIDDRVFFLGTSIKDAGKHPMNFSPSDSTANGHRVLDSILTKGRMIT